MGQHPISEMETSRVAEASRAAQLLLRKWGLLRKQGLFGKPERASDYLPTGFISTRRLQVTR